MAACGLTKSKNFQRSALNPASGLPSARATSARMPIAPHMTSAPRPAIPAVREVYVDLVEGDDLGHYPERLQRHQNGK